MTKQSQKLMVLFFTSEVTTKQHKLFVSQFRDGIDRLII